MAKKSITDVDLDSKRCLVRVDFNVPLEEKDGRMVITDDTRIQATLPTINHLIKQNARIILCSHLGRPKGKPTPEFSLQPVAEYLKKLLSCPVNFSSDCIGQNVQNKVKELKPASVLLLENLRFYAEEEENDPQFAQQLASLADIYVNDAFGTAHRAHASTEGVTHYIDTCVSGFLMQRELQFLGDELNNPKRPFIVILGGAKVSDKISVIDALLNKADTILIGGAMAYTFALAQNQKVGNSLSEPDKIETAKAALQKAKDRKVNFMLPIDHMIVEQLDFNAKTASPTDKFTKVGEEIPDGWQGVDIGPETTKAYEKEIASAGTILWNGPMGIFEIKACAQGTFAMAKAVAANTSAKSIIGGGDSVKAINKSGVADKITFMSTGGGASLEFLEGKTLPGVAALNDL